jgi:hypothetical protein
VLQLHLSRATRLTQQVNGGRTHVQRWGHEKKQPARRLCHVTIVTLRL